MPKRFRASVLSAVGALLWALASGPAWAHEPTGYFSSEEARVLPPGATVFTVGGSAFPLVPQAGLNLAQGAWGGEWRAHLFAANVPKHLSPLMVGGGWKQPLMAWPGGGWAVVGEASYGLEPMGAAELPSQRRLMGMASSPWTWAWGASSWSVAPKLVLMHVTEAGPVAVAGGLQGGLRWRLGEAWEGLAEVGVGANSALRGWVSVAPRVGLRWHPGPAWSCDASVGIPDFALATSSPGRQELLNLAHLAIAYGFDAKPWPWVPAPQP